ncbi:MAG: serine/threonine protein kinase, partial [Acidobacteria bacterium]|nr:serine/threonine protein kinase [Acidobacteriota bacterium]
ASREPLEVDMEKAGRQLPHLSSSDRDWLIDGAFHLLVPIVSFDGVLLGVIAMGEKKSGLPILKEDRQLLAAIANSAALALEVQRLRREGAGDGSSIDTPIPSLPTASPAQECFGCGRLYLPHNQTCPTCERELEPALVPYVMPGRFRFERRLGAGGMGVVYRAVDLSLSRPVAIKTMRRVSVDDALRLRREARAAAAVVHPNLALIYLVESWQGNPMLIMEYLEKGTLSDRLSREVLAPQETLALGAAMASALEKLHSANILHRDLKPSNIGYSLDGTPKLMDFGIARLQFDIRREAAVLTDGPTAVPGLDSMGWANMGTPATASRQLVGTLHYLSPEAVHGLPPDPTFDLWSLTAVLYECLTGDRIFRGTLAEVMSAIGKAEIPPLSDRRPGCHPMLVDFFFQALHADRSRRPVSAGELREQLEFLKQKV